MSWWCPAQTTLSATMVKIRTWSLLQKLSPAFPEIQKEYVFIPVGTTGLGWVCSVPHGLTPARAVSPRHDNYLRHVGCILKRISCCSCSTVSSKLNSFGCPRNWLKPWCLFCLKNSLWDKTTCTRFPMSLYLTIPLAFPPKTFSVNF